MNKEKLKPILKRVAKICCPIIGAELVLLFIILIGARLYMPTHYMTDQEALKYIVQMTEDERSAYITRLPNKEGDRLIRMWIAYKGAVLEKTSSFDSFESKDTERYQLTDGSGYVEIIDGIYHVYDNDGNEIDPTSIADEDGVIRMDL